MPPPCRCCSWRCSSDVLSEQQVLDLSQNFMRPQLTTVRGAAIPFSYGGRTRQIQVDLDPQAMQADGLSATDVENRAGQPGPDRARGHGQDRQLPIYGAAQQLRRHGAGFQRHAGQDGERRHHLHARCRPCARRLSAPAKRGACRWRARGALHRSSRTARPRPSTWCKASWPSCRCSSSSCPTR